MKTREGISLIPHLLSGIQEIYSSILLQSTAQGFGFDKEFYSGLYQDFEAASKPVLSPGVCFHQISPFSCQKFKVFTVYPLFIYLFFPLFLFGWKKL